ncbi:MAG TPA: DUF364 domain-containing protein [Methanocorpusculum sp.]|nr:DUF364 domain-containing protein [Methanocorpusculum sp.]
MWELYDALIEQIPDDITAAGIIVGNEITYVESSTGGVGIAPYRQYIERAPMITGNKTGMSLKELAGCVKSWNFAEASVGNAAINAWYNHPDTAKQAGIEVTDRRRIQERLNDPFINSQNMVRGKNVCVVGHFPFIEELFAPICNLHIIEWVPTEGDYPYTACEYILPECDYAYLTSAGLGDKSLPRLLELSENAKKVTLVGPGTPLAARLFDFDVDDLSGLVITDNALASRIISGVESQRIYSAGQKVHLLKE